MSAHIAAPLPGAAFPSESYSQLCLVIRYDGTDYHGFQKQAQGRTIQGELESHLTRLFGAGTILGASRTDVGVHAAGQVVVWRGPVLVPAERLVEVVNRRLPSSIQIIGARWVPVGWDPRRSSTCKQYSYRIWRGEGPADLAWHRFVHRYSGPLSWSLLQAGAQLFGGAHDFRPFRTEGSTARTTMRTILMSRWTIEDNGRIWRYQVVGDGFLYRMVRHMVGSMLAAAAPAGSLALIRRGLADARVKVTPLAPSRGLMLDAIGFEQEGVRDVSGSGIGAWRQSGGGGRLKTIRHADGSGPVCGRQHTADSS